MEKKLQVSVGYSDHTLGKDVSIAAVSLGAKIIEKHITISRNFEGPDHKSSLEVHAMDLLRKRISNIQNILGGTEKIITESEKDVMKKLRGWWLNKRRNEI